MKHLFLLSLLTLTCGQMIYPMINESDEHEKSRRPLVAGPGLCVKRRITPIQDNPATQPADSIEFTMPPRSCLGKTACIIVGLSAAYGLYQIAQSFETFNNEIGE